jgi:undecaprenyl diphosphate synthase
MDGNGRWAEGQGLPRVNGHGAASIATAHVIHACKKMKIPWVTFYAFSTENWNRPPEEVELLMRFREWLWTERVIEELNSADAKVHLIGCVDDLRLSCQELAPLGKFMQQTPSVIQTDQLHVAFAINYGGRAELINAFAKLKADNSESVSEAMMQASLFCPHAPDLDLVIRTGGDERLSNFMLWQLAYAELLFTDTLWPDFTMAHMYSAMNVFQSRQRRYGNVIK